MIEKVSDIRVIGVPRSGTNLVKYLVESYTEIRCHFHFGWWKHSVIPPPMQGTTIVEDTTPTIIVFRDPLIQLASFFKFTLSGGWAIQGEGEFPSFISQPITLNANTSISYRFSSPIDYWRQFYFATLNWQHENKWFVELEELQASPDTLMPILRKLLGDGLKIDDLRLPGGYLRRNVDAHIDQLNPVDQATDFRDERARVNRFVDSLSVELKRSVYDTETKEILAKLRAERVTAEQY